MLPADRTRVWTEFGEYCSENADDFNRRRVLNDECDKIRGKKFREICLKSTNNKNQNRILANNNEYYGMPSFIIV